MTKADLLERLYNHPCEDNPDYGPLLCGLRVEAMEEIKTLRARISVLEAELKDKVVAHYSDCPVNNAPALPVGECDCLEKSRARIAALEAAINAKDITIKTLSMLLRTNLLLRHPEKTHEEVTAEISKIVDGVYDDTLSDAEWKQVSQLSKIT